MKIKTFFFLFFLLNSPDLVAQDTVVGYTIKINASDGFYKKIKGLEVKMKDQFNHIIQVNRFKPNDYKNYYITNLLAGVYTCYFKNEFINDSTLLVVDNRNHKSEIEFKEDGKMKVIGSGIVYIPFTPEIYNATGNKRDSSLLKLHHLFLNLDYNLKTHQMVEIPAGDYSISIRKDNKVVFQDTVQLKSDRTKFRINLGTPDCIYLNYSGSYQPISLAKNKYLSLVLFNEPENLKKLLNICKSNNLNVPTYSSFANEAKVVQIGVYQHEIEIKANTVFSAFDSKSLKAIRDAGYTSGPIVFDETKSIPTRGIVSDMIEIHFVNGFGHSAIELIVKKYKLELIEDKGYHLMNFYHYKVPAGTSWGIFEIAEELKKLDGKVESAYPAIDWITYEVFDEQLD